VPAVSQAQRAYLNARFGHAWVKAHHFDNPGKLPSHVQQGRPISKKKLKHRLRKGSKGFY